jgi:hypothetical protein
MTAAVDQRRRSRQPAADCRAISERLRERMRSQLETVARVEAADPGDWGAMMPVEIRDDLTAQADLDREAADRIEALEAESVRLNAAADMIAQERDAYARAMNGWKGLCATLQEALAAIRVFAADSIENGHLTGGDLGNIYGIRDECDKHGGAIRRAEHLVTARVPRLEGVAEAGVFHEEGAGDHVAGVGKMDAEEAGRG